jgi:hypothetical protein
LDIRRGRLGEARLASSLALPKARLVRKRAHQGERSATLYIVAVAKADQATEIIRNKAANHGDEVEDLGHVTGFLVQAFHLAPGEFVRIDGKYKSQRQGAVVDSK